MNYEFEKKNYEWMENYLILHQCNLNLTHIYSYKLEEYIASYAFHLFC